MRPRSTDHRTSCRPLRTYHSTSQRPLRTNKSTNACTSTTTSSSRRPHQSPGPHLDPLSLAGGELEDGGGCSLRDKVRGSEGECFELGEKPAAEGLERKRRRVFLARRRGGGARKELRGFLPHGLAQTLVKHWSNTGQTLVKRKRHNTAFLVQMAVEFVFLPLLFEGEEVSGQEHGSQCCGPLWTETVDVIPRWNPCVSTGLFVVSA
eukprot:1842325-Rhodomonas_salina.2